jgi:glutamine cyclotransferase
MMELVSRFPAVFRPLAALSLVAVLGSCERAPETLGYKVVSSRPHDAACFTQGLEFHDGRLFESSGGYGNSNLREVDPATGKVLRRRPMAASQFAEGITVLNNELWVLTWKENTAHVLEPDTFKFIRSHRYEGEGWGLTNDGRMLIMSDGTSTLKFIDPKDFSVKRSVEVTRKGRPVDQINELEMVDGMIFANLYTSGEVIRIDPKDGRVTGTLDLSALRRQLPRPNQADVLNGIARDPATGNLLVTGKLWPLMFEIQVEKQ